MASASVPLSIGGLLLFGTTTSLFAKIGASVATHSLCGKGAEVFPLGWRQMAMLAWRPRSGLGQRTAQQSNFQSSKLSTDGRNYDQEPATLARSML